MFGMITVGMIVKTEKGITHKTVKHCRSQQLWLPVIYNGVYNRNAYWGNLVVVKQISGSRIPIPWNAGSLAWLVTKVLSIKNQASALQNSIIDGCSVAMNKPPTWDATCLRLCGTKVVNRSNKVSVWKLWSCKVISYTHKFDWNS